MTFSFEDIKKHIEKGTSDKMKMSINMYKELNLNVTGKGTVEALELIDRYENVQELRLREKLVKSNKALFSFITRPLDKVFTAKGGEVAYNLTNTEVKRLSNYTNDIADGLDIKEYIEKKVFGQYLIDPNAILFLEISEDGSELQPVIYNSDKILHYENRGNNVTAIIFEPFEKEDDKKKYYRVVDDSGDKVYSKEGNDIREVTDMALSLSFDFIPAFVLGDRFSLNDPIFEGFLCDVLEDAKDHLRDQSINLVHKMAHGYSKYWSYAEDCTKCGGDGYVEVLTSGSTQGGDAVYEDVTCSSCGGSGQKTRKNASDMIVLPVPQDGETTIAPHVAGYISPDIEIWNKYDENISALKHSMFESIWGTAYENDKTNETATGRFLDVQPVQDRLGGVSKHMAKIYQFILKGLVTVYLSKKDYYPNVMLGDRYIIETPKQALEVFTESLKPEIPYTIKSNLYDKYCEVENQSNNMEYLKKSKLFKVDPFPFQSVEVLKELGVPNEDLLKKIYYPSYVNTITDDQLIYKTVEQLQDGLTQFINAKTIKEDGTNKEA